MNKIIKILQERDGMTHEEAKELIIETREMLLNAETPSEADQIMSEQLGLEPDYIFDLIG